MSQPNPNQAYQQPFVTINDQYPYQNLQPQLQINTAPQTQHWQPLPQPRSLQDERNQARSRFGPIPTQRAAVNSGPLNNVNYFQMKPSPTGSCSSFGVGSGPSLLSPYGYDHRNEESWNSWNRRGSGADRARFPSHQSNTGYRTHQPPESDVDSQVLPSDEGYSSHITTQSVFSNEPGRPGSELAAPLMEQLSGMNVGSEPPAKSQVPSDHESRISIRSSRSKKNLKCPYCAEILKCNSDYKCVCSINIDSRVNC